MATTLHLHPCRQVVSVRTARAYTRPCTQERMCAVRCQVATAWRSTTRARTATPRLMHVCLCHSRKPPRRHCLRASPRPSACRLRIRRWRFTHPIHVRSAFVLVDCRRNWEAKQRSGTHKRQKTQVERERRSSASRDHASLVFMQYGGYTPVVMGERKGDGHLSRQCVVTPHGTLPRAPARCVSGLADTPQCTASRSSRQQHHSCGAGRSEPAGDPGLLAPAQQPRYGSDDQRATTWGLAQKLRKCTDARQPPRAITRSSVLA